MMTPSLSLDFTSAVLDPRITFARAGATATRVNASGFVESVPADTARFDFNPLTLACRGLLVEELRQNLALQSEDFAAASWFRTALASVNQNVEVAPTNTQVADSIIENTASSTHLINCVFTGAISSYALSVFAKKLSVGNARRLVIREGVATGAQACFDLTAGTVVGTAGGGSPSASIQSFGNGWYRCVLVFNNAASGTRNMQLAITRPTASSLDTYTGDGVSGLALFGAQVESGAFATSYIPTAASAVTRNADVATITGTNFSDWWQASKGGVLVRARPGTVSGVRPLVQFDDGTADNIIALRGNTTNPELYIKATTDQAQIDAGTIAANTDYSLTGWWATNDCKARLDSGAVVTDTSATIPTVTQARLGSDGTNYLNGHLASISYYDSFSEQIYTRRKNKAVFNLM